MSAPTWLVATRDEMWRANAGEHYPWTPDFRDARRFPTPHSARALIADAAAFTDRARSDYWLFRRDADGLTPEPTSDGARFAVSPYAPRYIVANEASDPETTLVEDRTDNGPAYRELSPDELGR